MMLVVAGSAGMDFVADLSFVSVAHAQDAAPAQGAAPAGEGGAVNGDAAVNGAAPVGKPAPTDTGEAGAPAGDSSKGAVGNTEQTENHEKGAFPPFNGETFPSQILWLVIIFGLFYLFLKRVVLPQVGGIIETRESRIRQDLDAAGRMKGEADAAVAAYEQALAEARANAGRIGQEARDAAKADAEAERKRVEGDLDAKLADAQTRIDAIKASAMGEVGTIAADTAQEIVRTLTGNDADRGAVDAAVSAVRG